MMKMLSIVFALVGAVLIVFSLVHAAIMNFSLFSPLITMLVMSLGWACIAGALIAKERI